MAIPAKIIKRIKNLLAMSHDKGSSKEAAIATTRVRAMMDKYQVTELDLTTVNESDFSTAESSTGRKRTDTPSSILAVAVAKLNDCQVSYTKTDGFISINFKGMFGDAVCATMLFEYLREECTRQAKSKTKGKANIFAYRVGFAAGVATHIETVLDERAKLVTSDSTALVACKNKLVAAHYGTVTYGKKPVRYSGSNDSYGDGYVAGEKAGLSNQVTGTNQKSLEV